MADDSDNATPDAPDATRADWFGFLFEHIADPVLVATVDGHLLDANAAACELLGYDKPELLQKHPWDFVEDASREEILALMQGMQPGATTSVQRRYRHRSGACMQMDLRMNCCRYELGDVVIVSCRDITHQRALEDRLRESERNLAEGQRLTQTGSWILHYDTGQTRWSLETARIFGFPDPPPSPPYREFLARVAEDDRAAVDRELRASFETGETRPLIYDYVLPDGTRKRIETLSQPVFDASGAVDHLVGTVMDVTERQQRENALRASELLARGQFESLTRTLDALAAESDPDRFLHHVFRSIAEVLDAHSVSAWRYDRERDLMCHESAYECGRLFDGADDGLAELGPPLRIQDVAPWQAIASTRRPCVLADIALGADFPGRARLRALGIVTIVVAPLLVAGEMAGAIGIRFTRQRECSAGELELVQAFANQAMLALELRRLSLQRRQSAVMAERNRLARDIHDTLAQGFTGVIAQLEASLGASASPAQDAILHIERAIELARTCLREARRSVHALRHQSLVDGSLHTALHELFHLMASGTPLQVDFVPRGEIRELAPALQEALLHIAQEGLTNTLRHAAARQFVATLSYLPRSVRLQMADDGQGFDPRVESNGYGLMGMRERVEALGGRLLIRARQGEGTELDIVFDSEATGRGQDVPDAGSSAAIPRD